VWHARGLRGQTDGRATSADRLRARKKGSAVAGKLKSRFHASGVAYEGGRTGGQVQAIPRQSGVTACNNKKICIYGWWLKL